MQCQTTWGGGLGGEMYVLRMYHTHLLHYCYIYTCEALHMVLFRVFLKKRDGGDFEFPRKLIPRGSSRKPLNHISGCSNF